MIRPATLCLAFASSPEGRVRAAVRAMQRAGVNLLYGDPGVFWCADRRAWEAVPNRWPRGVSLAGAVLLAYQPIASPDDGDPDADAHVAASLGVPLAWAEALGAGWDREPIPAHWLGTSSRQSALDGYEVGLVLRRELSVLCVRHNVRRLYWERTCVVCEEEQLLEQEGGAA